MLAKDCPTVEELNDPAFLAWNAKLFAVSPRSVSHLEWARKQITGAGGRAYDAVIEGYQISLPISEYAANVLGRHPPYGQF